jgi:hypothetical protein
MLTISLVTIELRHRADGQAEILIAGQSFPISEEPRLAVIPKELLQDVRLSELPGEIALKPSGVSMVLAGGEQVDCWLYGFRDGYGFARIQVTTRAGPTARLRALQEAVCERQEKQGDVEPTETGPPKYCGLSFLLDLVEDVPIPEALAKVEQALTELHSRRLSLLAKQPLGTSAAS